MSANKHIEREAKEALGIEIGRGKRVPKDRMKEFEAKVAELKVTARRPTQQVIAWLGFTTLWLQGATPNKRVRSASGDDDEAAGDKSENDIEELDLIKLSSQGRGRGRGRRGGRGGGRGGSGSKQLVSL